MVSLLFFGRFSWLASNPYFLNGCVYVCGGLEDSVVDVSLSCALLRVALLAVRPCDKHSYQLQILVLPPLSLLLELQMGIPCLVWGEVI